MISPFQLIWIENNLIPDAASVPLNTELAISDRRTSQHKCCRFLPCSKTAFIRESPLAVSSARWTRAVLTCTCRLLTTANEERRQKRRLFIQYNAAALQYARVLPCKTSVQLWHPIVLTTDWRGRQEPKSNCWYKFKPYRLPWLRNCSLRKLERKWPTTRQLAEAKTFPPEEGAAFETIVLFCFHVGWLQSPAEVFSLQQV